MLPESIKELTPENVRNCELLKSFAEYCEEANNDAKDIILLITEGKPRKIEDIVDAVITDQVLCPDEVTHLKERIGEGGFRLAGFLSMSDQWEKIKYAGALHKLADALEYIQELEKAIYDLRHEPELESVK